MKTFKRFFAVLTAVIIISASLCCTAFAEGEENGYIIDTDIIYAELPDDYMLDFTGNFIAFSDFDYNYLYVEAIENALAEKGISKMTAEEAQECFFNIFLLEGDEEYREYYSVKYEATEKTTVNGLSAYMIKGYYTFTDSVDTEEEYYSCFITYIMATEENVFMVTYEDYEGDLSESEDIDEVLKTLAINGTFFEGDKPTVSHDFSKAQTYEDALSAAEDKLYGSDDYVETIGGALDEETIIFTKVIIAIVFIVPFIVITIVTIVLIILYVKKKKELNRFEEQYGDIEDIHKAQLQYVNNVVYNAPVNAPAPVVFNNVPAEEKPAEEPQNQDNTEDNSDKTEE